MVHGPVLFGAARRRWAGAVVRHLLQLSWLHTRWGRGRVAVGLPGTGWHFGAVHQPTAWLHDGRGRAIWRGPGSGGERDRSAVQGGRKRPCASGDGRIELRRGGDDVDGHPVEHTSRRIGRQPGVVAYVLPDRQLERW